MNVQIRHEKWILVLLSGLFLFFVLFFYEGFNIDQEDSYSGHGLLSRSLIFGLVTSLGKLLSIHIFISMRHRQVAL